jgi:hypothetical protein
VIAFDPVEGSEDGEHVFAMYGCREEQEGGMVTHLAETVRNLYVDPQRLRAVLLAALSDASEVAETAPIEEAIDRTLLAAIPAPGTHAVPHLDVARNELAEALAHVALPKIHGTVIPASRIRHKEIPTAPARGLDLLGLEESPLTAVITEVKASDEKASPPGVVGAGDTSLRGQFLSFLGDDDALLRELNWALKHAAGEYATLIASALLARVKGTLPLVAAPVLVRPSDCCGPGDFGTFREDPAQFDPARVRFLILVIDRSLEEVARAVYEEARR